MNDDPFGRECPSCGNTLQNSMCAYSTDMVRCADCKDVFRNNLIDKKFRLGSDNIWTVKGINKNSVTVRGSGDIGFAHVPAEMFYRWVLDAKEIRSEAT